MIYAVIAGCEIGFWVLLLAGLTTRYLLHLRRVSTALLIGVPLVDLVLLFATVLDLRAGATADYAHSLAAVYIGFSVAFGHSMIRWADQRFARRFADGPPPWKPPKYGLARAHHEWREFSKAVLAAAITCGLLLAMVALVGDPSRTAALWGGMNLMLKVLAIWLIFPVVATIWPSKAAKPTNSDASQKHTM